MGNTPACSVCGAPAFTELVLDDGAKVPFCYKHIPDEDAKALFDQLHEADEENLPELVICRCGHTPEDHHEPAEDPKQPPCSIPGCWCPAYVERGPED